MATTIILRKNANTDDILRVADKGKCFGRRDYKVQVVYYTYANVWGDHEHFFHARTVESASRARLMKRREKVSISAWQSKLLTIKMLLP